MPSDYNGHYEPFVGGGALFFSSNPQNAFLSDTNEELIVICLVVKNDIEALFKTKNG